MLNPETGQLNILASFDGFNGAHPVGGLVADVSGNLYGVTEGQTSRDFGSVFKITAHTTGFSIIMDFNPFLFTYTYVGGATPTAGLIMDTAGNLYGTTEQGGPNSMGTAFKLSPDTGTYTPLALFVGPNGAYPDASLVADKYGNLYGTTFEGGSEFHGSVFEITAGTNRLRTLASFTIDNGAWPEGGLIFGPDGNLYGTTANGGANHDGTVFRISPTSGYLTTLASFNGVDGQAPEGNLIMDARGDLFGTTVDGGVFGDGTIFELPARSNTVTTLISFDGANGAYPLAGLIADAAGNLYGTTDIGGKDNLGSVFRLTDTGFVVPEPSTLGMFVLWVFLIPWNRRAHSIDGK